MAKADLEDIIVDVPVTTSHTSPPKRRGRPPAKKGDASIPPVVMEELGEELEGVPLLPAVSVLPMAVGLKTLSDVKSLFDFSGSHLTPVQQIYVMAFATRGTRAEACQVAECTYRQVDKWMEDGEFRWHLDNAVSVVADRLEGELIRRAMDGSDRLLIRAMEAARPEKYARVIKGDVSVVHSWAELARQVADTTDEDTIIEEVEDSGESD